MTDDLLKSPIFGPEGVVVSKMPLAEHAGGVAVVCKDFPEGLLALVEHGPAHDGMPRARTVGVVPAHQGAAGWRAGRGDVEIGQAHALAMEPIQMRCL